MWGFRGILSLGFRDIASLTGSVLLIIGVLIFTYYGTRWYAKRMGNTHGQGKYVRVIDRTGLGQGTAVLIVKVGEKYYLLGAGDKNVSMLTELESFVETPQHQESMDASFKQLFGSVMEKLKKPGSNNNGKGQ